MLRDRNTNNLVAVPSAADHVQISLCKAVGQVLQRQTVALTEECGA